MRRRMRDIFTRVSLREPGGAFEAAAAAEAAALSPSLGFDFCWSCLGGADEGFFSSTFGGAGSDAAFLGTSSLDSFEVSSFGDSSGFDSSLGFSEDDATVN